MSEEKPVKVEMAMTKRGVVIDTPDRLKALAQMIVASQQFKAWTNVNSAALAIQTGLELGFTPVQSLNSLFVVPGGQPELRAKACAALMIRHADEYRVGVDGEGKNRHAWVETTRKGLTAKSAYSMEEADRAKLTHRDNWKNYEDDMLMARVMSRHAKRYFADVTLGLEVVEVMDDLPPSVRNVAPAELPAPEQSDPLLAEPSEEEVEAKLEEVAAEVIGGQERLL